MSLLQIFSKYFKNITLQTLYTEIKTTKTKNNSPPSPPKCFLLLTREKEKRFFTITKFFRMVNMLL